MRKRTLKPKVVDEEFVWVIAYINSKLIKHVQRDLNKYPEYKKVEAYIPTVKILKKTFKKQNIFEEVPLLFNYGFFKIPRKYALHKDWLENMKNNISCIYAWVRDPARGMVTNGSIAIATSKDITRLLKESINLGAHTADEINLLHEGKEIVLRGYPWEGVNAKVLSIDHKNKMVRVEIRIFDQFRPTNVSFDNVFFTIYHSDKNYDDALMGDKSIDEMGKNFDKIQKKKWDAN